MYSLTKLVYYSNVCSSLVMCAQLFLNIVFVIIVV